jgi:hypothetical protein
VLRRIGGRIGRFVASAPLTFSWLAVLLLTTLIQHSLTGRQLHELLLRRSTNLHHLATDPIRVLFSSLLWLDGYYWWPYAVVFCLFLAPAERWLGWWRWLVVGLLAHIVATYLGEGFLYLRIQDAVASPRLINARDIGVSYFVVGIAGVLTYRVPRPWRWAYLVAILLTAGVPIVVKLEFTPLGHFTALLVGLACYPLTPRPAKPAEVPVGAGVLPPAAHP